MKGKWLQCVNKGKGRKKIGRVTIRKEKITKLVAKQ